MPSVFFLGTGYVGYDVLKTLKATHPDYSFRTLVRSEKNFGAIKALGSEIVKGSKEDVALVTEEVAKADVVVNVLDADDPNFIGAILAGAKKHFEVTGNKIVFLHTSGSAVILHKQKEGKADAPKIWNDADEKDIASIDSGALHGEGDVAIINANKEDYVKAYIICPGAIVGRSSAPFVVNSTFLRFVLGLYLRQKRIVHIGTGLNRFPYVTLEDTVDLFVKVFDFGTSNKDNDASAYSRYFFAISSNPEMRETARVLGSYLKSLGLISDVTPVSVPDDGGDFVLGLFSRDSALVAERAKALGWSPKPVDLEKLVPVSVDEQSVRSW